jgi:hypothetical protein
LPIGEVHDQSFIDDIMFFLDGCANNLKKAKSTFDMFFAKHMVPKLMGQVCQNLGN